MGHIRVASSKVPWPSTNLGQSEPTEYFMRQCHLISNGVSLPSLTLVSKLLTDQSNQKLLSSGWRGISINHLIVKSQNIKKVQLDRHQIRLQMFESVVYCYFYHVRFHRPQRAHFVLYFHFSFLWLWNFKCKHVWYFEMFASISFCVTAGVHFHGFVLMWGDIGGTTRLSRGVRP